MTSINSLTGHITRTGHSVGILTHMRSPAMPHGRYSKCECHMKGVGHEISRSGIGKHHTNVVYNILMNVNG